MGKLFGSENFDPKLILSQIFLLQTLFYLVNFTLTAFLNSVFGIRSHLDQILSAKALATQDSYSMVFILTSLLSIPFIVVAIVYFIERTSKCLDFTATTFVFHLIIVFIYSGVPTNIMWWGINGGTLFAIVLISEYVCLKIEQQEISIAFSSKKKENT